MYKNKNILKHACLTVHVFLLKNEKAKLSKNPKVEKDKLRYKLQVYCSVCCSSIRIKVLYL